jgi:hypothetical protein
MAAAIHQGLAPRLSEVDPPGELPHDEQVDAPHDLGLQRRGVGERGKHRRGPQVGEQAELLADAQQPLLRPRVDGHVVPARSPDGAEQHGPAVPRARDHLVGERGAVGVDRRAADETLFERELDAGRGRRRLEHATRLLRHLRAHSVSGQDQDALHQTPRGSATPWRRLCQSSLLIACT